jgi:hypothetical protein
MKKKHKIIVAIACVIVGVFGAGVASAGTVASLNGLGSLFQFVGDGVMAENTSTAKAYLKCVTEMNDGWVFPLPGKSSLDAAYPLTKGNVVCAVVNVGDSQALSHNFIKVRGFNEGVEVPVMSYVANAKRGVKMGTVKKDVLTLVLDGKTGHYAAPPLWVYLGVVPTYVAGTVNQDLTDNRKPFLSRIHEFYTIWRANRYPTCITDFGDFVPYYNDEAVWITGINNSSACGGPALITSLHGYGIDKNGNVVLPSYGGAAGSGWVKLQRSTPVAMDLKSLSSGIPCRVSH